MDYNKFDKVRLLLANLYGNMKQESDEQIIDELIEQIDKLEEDLYYFNKNIDRNTEHYKKVKNLY